jgi:hypothetical protein
MTNLPPEFDLITEYISRDHLKFSLQNLIDPDGDDSVITVKWIVEYKTPIDDEYKVIYESDYQSDTEKEFYFEAEGTYKVTASAKDVYDLVTEKSVEVTIEVQKQYCVEWD